MKKRKNKFEKLAIGVFVDGLTLQVATLCKQKGKTKLVDANILKLATRLESVGVEEPALVDEIIGDSEDGLPLDITSELEKNENIVEEPIPEDLSDNASILENELSTYSHRKFKLGISVSEPEIYYAPFNTDWGLKGDELKKKIIEILAVDKPSALDLKTDDIQVVEVANKDLLAIVRGSEFQVLNLLEKARKNHGQKLSRISFIEGAEISLVNLVKKNYKFEPNEISVIVYVGHEFSRLIFLLGNELLGISQMIGEGIDSMDVSHTVFSRLLLELDNMNLKKMDSIILCGEAYETDILSFLKEKFSSDVDIDYLNFNNIEVEGIDPLLSRFAISMGVAWRALEEKNDGMYQINLVPKFVRERQKIFKLGVSGWLLLLCLPILTFLFTNRIAALNKKVEGLKSEYKSKQEQLALLQEPKKELEDLKFKAAGYENIFSRLDSLFAGTKTWSHFLRKVAISAKTVGGIWVTDVKSTSAGHVTLSGFSLYRNKIPDFSNRLGDTVLNKVEVQEIRERTVYSFEIDIKLEQK